MTTPNQSPVTGRTAEFGLGQNGDPDNVASSLDIDSERQNAAVAGVATTPHSVLQSIHRSTIGLGPDAESRMLMDGSLLPTGNGSSQESNTAAIPLRLVGDNV